MQTWISTRYAEEDPMGRLAIEQTDIFLSTREYGHTVLNRPMKTPLPSLTAYLAVAGWNNMLEPQESCLFCTNPAARVRFANDLAYGIVDQFPITSLHALIIPKRHVGMSMALLIRRS